MRLEVFACTMKVFVVISSLVLCCAILANGQVEWQMDPVADLEEMLGDVNDIDETVSVEEQLEELLEDGSGG